MDIAAWLDGLGLSQYEEAFRSNHIGWELLATLTSNDLREMGVASVGHRKRLLAAIAALAGPADATLLALVSRQAERRQVTVMFVDLVGSTALASSLDPEEMSELLGAYQSVVLKELARFEGHLARFLGDGVLVYFGWPKAHEDAAERAVRSGLAIAAAVGRLSAPTGARLMARVGIATGLVVVGELVGKGAAREETVVGETPNLAARLQAVAEPAQVVIGDGTRRLLGALFELESLGPQLLKGISGPVPAFVVRGARASKSRFQARYADAFSPMVGRGPELALLLERWRRAKAGEGGGVLLVGDAGIGKSRLSQALLDAMADEPHARFHYQSSPLHTDSPLWPVVQQLTHAAGFDPDDEPGERLDKLEALLRQTLDDVTGVAPLLASLLGIEVDGRYPPLLDLALQQRRARTLEVLVGLLVGLASRQPVLALFEDVHWLDPTTRELIELALERIAASRVLLLLTSRPNETLALAWRPAVTRLPLGRLATPQAMAIAECVAQGRTLPVECLERIVAKAEGVPLFVEELTRSLLEAELAGDSRVRVDMLPLAIPSTLQGSLIARLDRLASAKEVGQVAACIGREFSVELLASAMSPVPRRRLASALKRLIASGLVLRRGKAAGAIYAFKHALLRDAAYETLLKSKRRVLHGRIARALEEQFPKVAEAEPEVLAFHCTEAALTGKAVGYWHKAGQMALARSAHAEAVAQLTKAVDLLAGAPEGIDRRYQELDVQVALGRALIGAKGEAAPETGLVYARARQICEGMGDVPQALPAIYGQYIHHFGRGELDKAKELAEEFARCAERRDDVSAKATGYRILGSTLLHLGRLAEARVHLERALALDAAAGRGQPPGLLYPYNSRVICLTYLTDALLLLGYPDQASSCSRGALAEARATAHPGTLALALAGTIGLRQDLRDLPTVEKQARELVALATEQDLTHFRLEGALALAWVTAQRGRPDKALEAMHQNLAAMRAEGTGIGMAGRLLLIAGVCGKARRVSEGLDLLIEALAVARSTGDRWFEAELHRLTGELLLLPVERDECAAEASFHQAIAVARQQGARMWELRAVLDLARLYAEDGERWKAHDILATVYGWFAEGFDTPDLEEAKVLLDQLASAPLGTRARPRRRSATPVNNSG